MNNSIKNIIKFSLFAIFLITGFIFFSINVTHALTIADQNGIPSACPNKYPNNTGHCTVFIDSITVNGFVDNDTSYTARTTPVPYGYLIPGQTITISWTDNTDGWNDPYGTSINNYLVKYGCGNSIDLSDDNYTIGAPMGRKYISWTVPSSISNYQYCKIWVYAKGITSSSQPTLGVSNTRAFSIQPPLTRYTCNSNYQCVVASNGEYTSLTSCQNNCVAPVRYSCNTSTYQCYQTTNGTYANYNDCVSACQPPLTRYTCNSNYQCVVASNGEYTSLTSCQNNCVAPVRYSCNTSTYQCYQTTNGTYANYNDCVSACQPPLTRYTCNSNYQCVVASNGEYTSLTSCQNNCVAPNQCTIISFTSNNYNINSGDNIILNWNTSNCNYCSASSNPNNNYWWGSLNTYGSRTIYNISSNTTFTLTCSNNNSTDSENITISTQTIQPTLSLWADSYTLKEGDSTYLRWIANNANYCVASNAWSGNRSLSGYEYISPQSNSTYTLTCYSNTGASITQSVTINVVQPTTALTLIKLGRNVSKGNYNYNKITQAQEGDIIEFYLAVVAGSSNDLYNTVLTDNLPSAFTYISGSTKINGVSTNDNSITSGLNLGTIPRGTYKIITFRATANNPGNNFTYTNTAQVQANNTQTISDTATITYGMVAGAATVETGAEDTVIIALILSLVITILAWYYLKFNSSGKLLLARTENKIRTLKLEALRRQFKI